MSDLHCPQFFVKSIVSLNVSPIDSMPSLILVYSPLTKQQIKQKANTQIKKVLSQTA